MTGVSLCEERGLWPALASWLRSGLGHSHPRTQAQGPAGRGLPPIRSQPRRGGGTLQPYMGDARPRDQRLRAKLSTDAQEASRPALLRAVAGGGAGGADGAAPAGEPGGAVQRGVCAGPGRDVFASRARGLVVAYEDDETPFLVIDGGSTTIKAHRRAHGLARGAHGTRQKCTVLGTMYGARGPMQA